MKKFLFILSFTILTASWNVNAQSNKDQAQERKEIAKQSRKELEQKASKAARKEAKSLEKEGWKVAPGALPIEKQLDKAYLMQFEYDEDGFQKYLIGEGMSTAGNYDAAKMQALELAKQNLAGQIQTEVEALIENTVANDQLSHGDAESITRTIIASKNRISQSLGRIIPITELYRNATGNNKEVFVRIAYNSEMAKRALSRAIREELEAQGNELHTQLDHILGIDKPESK